VKKPTEKELSEQLSRLRRWRVKPEKDLRIGPLIQRAANDPTTFAEQVKNDQRKREQR